MLRERPVGSTQLVTYEECGHVPMDEFPERFNADVASFLEDIYSSAAASELAPAAAAGVAGNGAGVSQQPPAGDEASPAAAI